MPTQHTTAIPNARLGFLKNLLAGPHGPGSRIFEELAKFTNDYLYFKEDFIRPDVTQSIGAAANGCMFQYAESAAGPVDVAKITPTAALQSHVLLDLGATDPSSCNIIGPKCFAAKFNPFWESRFQTNLAVVNDTTEFAFGFVDAVPASAGAILGDIDTPTFAGGIADAAVIGYDSDETLKTAAFQTIGTSTAVAKTTIAGAAPFTVPTINVDVTYRVELRSATPDSSVSTAYAFINGALVAERSGPDAEKLLTPVFWVGHRGTTATYSIDYLTFGQEKNGAPFN